MFRRHIRGVLRAALHWVVLTTSSSVGCCSMEADATLLPQAPSALRAITYQVIAQQEVLIAVTRTDT